MLKSLTHPAKAAAETGRRSSSAESRDKRDKKPRDASDTKTSSSERRDAQERQKAQRAGKSSKPEPSAGRQDPGIAKVLQNFYPIYSIHSMENNQQRSGMTWLDVKQSYCCVSPNDDNSQVSESGIKPLKNVTRLKINTICVTLMVNSLSCDCRLMCARCCASEDIVPYSRPSFPAVHSPRGDKEPSSSSSMSSRGSGGRRRGEGVSGSHRNPAEISLNTVGAFQPGEEQLEVRLRTLGYGFPRVLYFG